MKTITFVAAALSLALSLPAAASAESSTDQTDLDALRLLSHKMCTQLHLSRTMGSTNAGEKIENHILDHLAISRQTEGYKTQVAGFWNANAQHLICTDTVAKLRGPILFMKRVVDMEMQKTILYGFLLSDPEDYAVTVNHTEFYNGKAETMLDFLDGILRDKARHVDYDIDEIQELREVLIEDYGAINARDLKGAKAPETSAPD